MGVTHPGMLFLLSNRNIMKWLMLDSFQPWLHLFTLQFCRGMISVEISTCVVVGKHR